MLPDMKPRLLRPLDTPLGLYLRPGRNDHQKMLDLLAEGPLACSGFVLDASLSERQAELRAEVVKLGFEAVLDPRACEMATEGGFARAAIADLPWAADHIHTRDDLRDDGGVACAEALADFVSGNGYNATFAPTHLLESYQDPWLEIDAAMVRHLRARLDRRGLSSVPIYYPLAVTTTTLRDGEARARLLDHVARLPIDALWLRISPFGASSGPLALKRYLEAARDLQAVGVPLVAEKTGTAGLPLLAFGGVGGIEGGITLGERFDARGLLRPRKTGKPFAKPPRVYVARLGVFMERAQARALFENRQMKALLACKDERCCRRGSDDMLADPRRHFVLQRAREVSRLSRAPYVLRPQIYMDEFLRDATDLALQAAKVDPTLVPSQRRLESWRITLSSVLRDGFVPSDVAAPTGQRATLQSVGA